MFDFITNIFQPAPVEFPKDTSWMLNDDLSPNKNNLRRCKEFSALKDAKQPKKFHAEGDAWKHTILVAKEMNKLVNNDLYDLPIRDKRVLMIAALCHDLGKATTTYYDEKDGEWHCKNHGAAGEKITRNLLFNEPDFWLREEVCWLVRHHMTFHHLHMKSHKEQVDTITRLSQGNSTVRKLLYLNMADSFGSKTKEVTRDDVHERLTGFSDIAIVNDCLNKPYLSVKNKSNYTMYMMIGVPGSGKDYYIKEHLPEVESICRDDIREELACGYVSGKKLMLDKEQENRVTEIVNARMKKCCEDERDFVINQTNMKKKYRDQLKETALKYGKPNIVYVYVEAPSIEVCKERRGGGKWGSIVDNMWNNFEFPDKSECDKLVIEKQK